MKGKEKVNMFRDLLKQIDLEKDEVIRCLNILSTLEDLADRDRQLLPFDDVTDRSYFTKMADTTFEKIKVNLNKAFNSLKHYNAILSKEDLSDISLIIGDKEKLYKNN